MAESAAPGSRPAGVFINCPFDDEFKECHHAVLLCVVACGLEPRSALESGTTSAPRMQRISVALRDSALSIHDLTRAHGQSDSNLARFNMPFEFGMAFLLAESASALDTKHDWLALLPSDHPYGEFISDLAGYDLKRHEGTAASIIPPVLAWLYTRPEVGSLPSAVTPEALIALLPDLEKQIAAQDEAWGAHLPWHERIKVLRDLVASRFSDV